VTLLSISVVIPVKDDAESLQRCLRLLTPQLRQPDDLVVVDNGSSDNSVEVAESFGARVVTVAGGGIPAASAAGYDSASASVIARLDADCVPEANWLDSIRHLFADRPEVDAFTGWASFYDGPRWGRRPLMVVYLGSYYLSLAPALGHVPMFGSNCAFRREAWLAVRDEVHRNDEGVHDDLDVSFHLGANGRIRFAPTLRMGISMRPFFDARSFAIRLRRGMHSVVVHWPAQLPWLRWFRRVRRVS
jgi:glycosyltransferase involved in cell wall biosynthesis